MVVSPGSPALVVCIGCDVYVFDRCRLCIEVKLEGHDEVVSAAEFVPSKPAWVATGGDDRVVCLWDIDEVGRLGRGYRRLSWLCGL